MLRLGFVGDVWLCGRQPGTEECPQWNPFAKVRSRLRGHDILAGNLECFFTEDMENARGLWKHRKALKAHPAQAGMLQEAGFDIVNLANNHMMDGGARGLEETIETLDQLRISSVGAGRDLREAEEAKMLCAGGRMVAFLCAGDSAEDYAAPQRPGIAPMDPSRRLLSRVAEAAEAADIVVVQLHGDLEFSAAPAPYRVRLSRELVDHGAALVIQHHPHVVQGVEMYHGGLIAYSMGNFAFRLKGNGYQRKYRDTRYGGILSVELDDEGRVTGWAMEPVRIGDDHRPAPLKPRARELVMAEFVRRNRLIQDAGTLRRLWGRRCREEAFYHALMAYYKARRGQYRHALQYIGVLPRRPRNRRWIGGVLTGGRL